MRRTAAAGVPEAVKKWVREQFARLPLQAVWPIVFDPTSNHLMLDPEAGGGRVAKSKPGGVPGRSGSICGSALVTLYDLAADGTLTAGRDARAFNLAAGGVAGSVFVQLKTVQGRYVVDWEECPA